MKVRLSIIAGATAAAMTALASIVAVSIMTGSASAATLFSDNFDDGNADGWSKSGGEWSVVTDGSPTFQQSKIDSELARQFAGSSSWTNYTVQARVKPLAFGSPTPFVGIAARSTGATTMYRLVLTNGNRAELQAHNGSSVTVIGGANLTVSTNTWYTLRITATGTSISGFVNNTQIASGTNSQFGSGRIALLTFHANARFDDVLVTDTAGPGPSSPPSSPTSSPRPPSNSPSNPPTSSPIPPGGIVGWATQGGGTTGGSGGSTVTVTSLAALTTAASSTATQTILVNGNFSCSADVRVMSNKTIQGVGSNSGLNGCGLNMRDVSNVIVRNMRISNVLAGNGNGDAIHIDHATRLWIDHNDLSSNTTSGTDTYDGLADITHAADFITVSWNRFHDHIKCSLVGHSDSNAAEDRGHLRVTYHHNLFSNCAQRNPRVRFGNPVHVFNNYYFVNNLPASQPQYGVASTIEGGVRVERNYFENIPDPFHVGEGSSPDGTLVAIDNFLVNSGGGETAGSVAGIPYSYTAEPAANVKASVLAGAGTGRI